MRLTLVLPTYNEAENLPRLIPAVLALPLDLRVLVVDDNSPDGTGQVAEALQQTYPGRVDVLHRAEKRGLGTAYLEGFRYALNQGAEGVIQMDADFSHPIEMLPSMAALLSDGEADMVLGSRYVPGGAVDERWAAWRKGLSAFGNAYARAILRVPIRDVTGGYRLWHSRALRAMPLHRVRSNGYVFQVEMAYLAHKLGLRVIEVPIYFRERQWGRSKMSFRIQAEAAIGVWRLLFRYRDL